MSDQDAEKALAARRAVDEVKHGMLVGLGTGSTSTYAIRELAERVSQGLVIQAVGSSLASEELASSLGIDLLPGEQVPRLDLAIDGADEVDPAMRVIKGGGGALFREKVVAAAADCMIVMVDSSKVVEQLGKFPLPIEVLPFAAAWVRRSLELLGIEASQRMIGDKPFLTDQQNYIFDARLGQIEDPKALASKLSQIPGVVEHGLFLSEVDKVMIARGGDIEIRERTTGG